MSAALLRSILFAAVYYIGSVATVSFAVIESAFGQEATIRGSRRWALWHRWCARHILGLSSRVEGDLPQSGALIVFKHESMFEAVETLALFDRPAVVMKREVVDMFGWGYVARRHGVIPVDREAGATALRSMLAAAKAAKAAGRPIILFPEGTRVPHGESPPLRAGLAGLYKILGWPVVPVALDSGRFSPKGSFIKRGGTVTMRVGEAIPPGLPREEIEARVFAAINALNDPPGRNRGDHHPDPVR
jgi:1-acyl-sn-glycerol-3-phosphate acyltransferase